MDSLQGIEVITAIFGILTPILSALGILFIREASEKEKDIWTTDSVLDKIIWEYRYREIYPTIIEFVEFYDEARTVRKEIKLEDVILEPPHHERTIKEMEHIGYFVELSENANPIILEIIKYFDDARREKRRLTLKEITHDSSNIEEIENKLRKIRKELEEEENIRRTHQNLRDSCSRAGWLLVFSAFISFLGIFLVGIVPTYFSVSPMFFWVAEIGFLVALVGLALVKYRRSQELKKIFLNYRMEYARSRPYSRRPGGE
ncbi:MAG: hypothetical protein HXS44_16890 [Theionarchaea archaeon]|nr:hypothetical protein [Theionarchaea archaeon]